MKLLLFIIIVGATIVSILKRAQKLGQNLEKIRKNAIVVQTHEREEAEKIVGTEIQLYGQDPKLPVFICGISEKAEKETDNSFIKFLLEVIGILIIAIVLMLLIA